MTLFKIVPNEALFQQTWFLRQPLFGEFQRRSALSKLQQLRSMDAKSHLNGESRSGRRERPGALACTGRRAYAPGQGPYRGQGQGPCRQRRQEDQQQGRAAEASFRGSWRRVIRQSQAPPPANSCACLSARLSSCSSRGASPPPLRPSSPRKLAPCGLRTQRAGLSGWRSGRQAQSA